MVVDSCGCECMGGGEGDVPMKMRPEKFIKLMAETWLACQRAASIASYPS